MGSHTLDISPRFPSVVAGRLRSKSLSSLSARAFAPVDIAILAAFRVIYGALMLLEMRSFFTHDQIRQYYIDPAYHFTYYGFDWVKPLPGPGMYVLFATLMLLAGCIMLGLWYRVTAALFVLGYSYIFLLDVTRYQNHYYWYACLGLLLAVIPSHRALSLDARFRRSLHSDTAPVWALGILRFQVAVVYAYSGFTKFQGDWLRGEPMRMWMADRTGFPLIGHWFTQEWLVYAFSYAGLCLDLLVVPALLWRRTRPFAFVAALSFNLMNARLFELDLFPWLMIAALTLFLSPSWPRFRGLWRPAHRPDAPSRSRRRRGQAVPASMAALTLTRSQRLTIAFLGAYLAIQLLVPLRYYLYPGPTRWTEEGFRFSWAMRSRAKWGDGTTFFITDPVSHQQWTVNAADDMPFFQFDQMAYLPDLILQYAHHLADRWRADGYPQVEVRVEAYASLNGRPSQLLVDPDVDLAAQPRTLLHQPWIAPLTEPLPTGE